MAFSFYGYFKNFILMIQQLVKRGFKSKRAHLKHKKMSIELQDL